MRLRFAFFCFLFCGWCSFIFAQDCKIAGVMSSGVNAQVIIGSETYSVGDSVCGGKITDVTDGGRVTVDIDGQLNSFSAGSVIEPFNKPKPVVKKEAAKAKDVVPAKTEEKSNMLDNIKVWFNKTKDSLTKKEEPVKKEGQVINAQGHLTYKPFGLDENKRYPVVFVFSPGADANGSVSFWRDVADECKLIIVASKLFRNDSSPKAAFDDVDAVISQEAEKYLIDPERVVTAGLSGGGMASHMFSVSGKVWAVITTCGRIHPDFLGKDRHLYPRGKRAVFLSGDSDYNREYMRKDKAFLDQLGWKTKWIDFVGGHTMAPKEKYTEAIKWLQSLE